MKEDITVPLFTTDDATLLFADVDRPVGFLINHNDSGVFYIIPKWWAHHWDPENGWYHRMDGNPYEIDLRRPRTELVVILGKLLGDKALEEWEEYE